MDMQRFSRTTNSPVMYPHYWAVENIRTLQGLGDLSLAIRRQLPYGYPDRIFNIFIQNGIVKAAFRNYPDYINKKWVGQFDVGTGTAVAIAFNGYWRLYAEKWRFITEKLPHLFWVDNSKRLIVQIWDDIETRLELSTDVVKVKAIRAWKNPSFITHDQGLIAGYIKSDGKVYYRNYCRQVDGNAVWEIERQVEEFTGTAVNLNLFITNDYRVGFIIEDSNGKIHWLITTRDWAGMAIPAEKIISRPNINVDFIETTKHKRYYIERITSKPNIALDFLYASSFNEFTHIENVNDVNGDFGKIIIFNTVYELFGINPLDFELIDERGIVFVASNISKISPLEYRLDFVDFNNAKGKVKLICKGDYTLNAAGYAFDYFEGTFMPTGLVPTVIPVPEVEVIWNE